VRSCEKICFRLLSVIPAKAGIQELQELTNSRGPVLECFPAFADRRRGIIVAGILPVSQGYIFAANLGSPDFFTIFNEIMEKPVTNAKLEKMLTAYKKGKSENKPAPVPMQKQVAHLQSIKSYIEMEADTYTKPDLEVLIKELKAFLALAEKQLEAAPEVLPEKKPGKRPMV
jgi:hypothetical protein